MVTIHRRLYSGAGFPLSNGSGLALTLEQTVDSLEQAIYDLLCDVRAVVGGPGSTVFEDLGATRQQAADARKYARAALAAGTIAAVLYPPASVPVALAGVLSDALLEEGWDQDATVPTTTPATQTNNIYAGTQAIVPVTPPPAGYGGDSAADVAIAVWGYLLGTLNAQGQNHNITAGNLLGFLGTLANIYGGKDGQGDIRTPWFRWVSKDSEYTCSPPWGTALPPWNVVPHLDFTLVQADDTVLSYLAREYPAWDWTTDDPMGGTNSGRVWALVLNEAPYVWLRCTLTDQDLHHLTTTVEVTAITPPVWPGIANVTLGEAVAFNDLIEVDGPMDGVLIAYTTPPSKVSIYSFGRYTAYGRAGQLAFVSDNGQVEEEQWLQFNQALYTPKAMARAASCLVRPIAGQEGTITPWTVT